MAASSCSRMYLASWLARKRNHVRSPSPRGAKVLCSLAASIKSIVMVSSSGAVLGYMVKYFDNIVKDFYQVFLQIIEEVLPMVDRTATRESTEGDMLLFSQRLRRPYEAMLARLHAGL